MNYLIARVYIIAMNTMLYAAAATIRPSALWMAVVHVHALQLASVVSVSVMPLVCQPQCQPVSVSGRERRQLIVRVFHRLKLRCGLRPAYTSHTHPLCVIRYLKL